MSQRAAPAPQRGERQLLELLADIQRCADSLPSDHWPKCLCATCILRLQLRDVVEYHRARIA